MPGHTSPDLPCASAMTMLDLRASKAAFAAVEASGERPVVLLATNGSRSATAATSLAADLAATFDAALRIIHVIAPIEYRVGRFAPTRAVERKLDCPYESPVLLKARQLAWGNGAAATLELVAGEPASAIVSAAEHVDLLVIGGSNRAAAHLRARTRRWVETHAACPVLASPHPNTPEHGLELLPRLIRWPGKPRFAPH